MQAFSLHRAARLARKGMTLVEIMVVIAIVGVLMTVLAVGVTGFLDSANADATKIQIKKAEEVLLMYSAKHRGKYPATSEGLEKVKQYFPNGEVPVDAWGNAFQYFSPGTHGDHPYELISLGKDGKEGGDGANADLQSWSLDQ